jgi:hypothetical protein
MPLWGGLVYGSPPFAHRISLLFAILSHHLIELFDGPRSVMLMHHLARRFDTKGPRLHQ